MNNCPKCGNPVQAGITSCPICGTSLQKSDEVKPEVTSVQKEQEVVKTVVPVEGQKAVTSQVAKPVQPEQSVVPTPQPVKVEVNESQPAPTGQVTTSNVEKQEDKKEEVAKEVAGQVEPAGAPVVNVVPAAPSTTANPPVEPVIAQGEEPKQEQVTPPQVGENAVPVGPVTVEVPVQTPEQVSSPGVEGTPAVGSVSSVNGGNIVTNSEPIQASVTPVVVAVEPQVVTTPVTNSLEQPVVEGSVALTAPVINTGEQNIQNGVNGEIIPPAPTIQNNASVMPVPNVPSSLNNNGGDGALTINNPTPVGHPAANGKKLSLKINKKVILIVIVFIFLVVGGTFIFKGTSSPSPGGGTVQPVIELNGGKYISNGYKFSLAEGWVVTEGSGNVIISNAPIDEATVQIRLSHSTNNIEDLTEDKINDYIKMNEKLTKAEVAKTQVGAKDTYLLTGMVDTYPVQIYFIGGGSRLTLGAVIVYSSNESKEKYEAMVQETIGTVTYSDDSIKALGIVNKYEEIFNIYKEVITHSISSVVFEEPSNLNVDNNNNTENDEDGSNEETPVDEENDISNEEQTVSE